MRKSMYKGLKVGEIITVTEPIKCYYYNYPTGKNLVMFNPGDYAAIVGFPPKVTKRKSDVDRGDYFVMFDAKGERFGTTIDKIKKSGYKFRTNVQK
jgi:hypothetical protein